MNTAPGAVSSQKVNPEWVPQDCFVLPIQGKWWCGRCDLRRCLRLTCQGPLGRIADVSFGTDDLCMSLSNFYTFRKRHQSGNSEFLTCTRHFAYIRTSSITETAERNAGICGCWLLSPLLTVSCSAFDSESLAAIGVSVALNMAFTGISSDST